MKKYIPWLLAAAVTLPVVSTAQTFTFSTNSAPGIVVSTNPFGTGVGVSTPFFNTIYTSDGYYDGSYYRHHKHPKHRKHRLKPRYKSDKAHRKAMKKARKAYRKEMKKQYKKSYRHHGKRHHDD